MQIIDITGRMKMTAEIIPQVDNSSFQNQMEQYPLALPPVEGENSAENLQSLNETINNNTDSFKGNTAIMKEFGDIMPEIIKNLRNMSSAVSQTTSNLPAVSRVKTLDDQRKQRIDEYNRQNFLGILNTGSGALQSLSGGNIGGAGIGIVSGASNAVSNYSKMAGMEGLESLSKGLLVGGTALAAAAAIFKGGKALSDAYKDAMPSIFSTGKAFGTTDNEESLSLYKTVNRYSAGTNLENSEFNAIVQSLRKQGVGNEYSNKTSQAIAASQIAETTAKWAYATGGDANQYAQLAGIMSRYGGSKNVSEDFNYLVASAKAQGLNDTQIPEFLTGIQKVMEDGIAKGFTRSSTEVAQTLTMFSKMSGGNAFWQTEKGAQMLNQMNSGVAGATSLSKTSDMLVYQAFSSIYGDNNSIESTLNKDNKNKTYIKGGGYVNMMQLIEQGVNADNFASIMAAAKNASGGDINAETEFLKDIFGLNYTGAGRLLNLDWKSMSKDQLDKEIQKITTAPENQNNETKWKNDLNRVAEALESGGAKIFGSVTLKGMDAISTNVEKITKWLVKDEENGSTSPLSGNNIIEDQLEDEGLIDPMFYENKKLAAERLKKLPQWKQDLATSLSSTVNPGGKGEGYLSVADTMENLDLTKRTWDSPYVERGSYDDLNAFQKGLYYLASPMQKQQMLYNLGYKVNKNFKEDTSVSDVVSEVSSLKIQSLLSKGTVSQDDFMKAIAQNKKLEESVTKAAKNGWIDDKEQKELATILQKIFDSLEKGITVNQND